MSATRLLLSHEPAFFNSATETYFAAIYVSSSFSLTYSIAYLAHSVETEVLGRQSGIQDQLCAAYGGVNYIEIARRHGARGWKVNGAGGEGGSVTILGGDSSHRTRAMLEEIEASDALYRRVPISLGPDGLRAWKRMLE